MLLCVLVSLSISLQAQSPCECPDFQLTNAEFVSIDGMPLSVMLLMSPKVCNDQQFTFDMGVITLDGKTYSAEVTIEEGYEEALFVNTLKLITSNYKHGSPEASAAMADIVIANKIPSLFAHYMEKEKTLYVLYYLPKQNWLGVQMISEQLLEKGE